MRWEAPESSALELPARWVKRAHDDPAGLSLPRRHGNWHARRAVRRRGAARLSTALADAHLFRLGALGRVHDLDDLARRLLGRARVERRLRVVLDPELDRLRHLRPGDP